jgi:hypothetical protein
MQTRPSVDELITTTKGYYEEQKAASLIEGCNDLGHIRSLCESINFLYKNKRDMCNLSFNIAWAQAFNGEVRSDSHAHRNAEEERRELSRIGDIQLCLIKKKSVLEQVAEAQKRREDQAMLIHLGLISENLKLLRISQQEMAEQLKSLNISQQGKKSVEKAVQEKNKTSVSGALDKDQEEPQSGIGSLDEGEAREKESKASALVDEEGLHSNSVIPSQECAIEVLKSFDDVLGRNRDLENQLREAEKRHADELSKEKKNQVEMKGVIAGAMEEQKKLQRDRDALIEERNSLLSTLHAPHIERAMLQQVLEDNTPKASGLFSSPPPPCTMLVALKKLLKESKKQHFTIEDIDGCCKRCDSHLPIQAILQRPNEYKQEQSMDKNISLLRHIGLNLSKLPIQQQAPLRARVGMQNQ